MNADERGLKRGQCPIALLLLFVASLGAGEKWTQWGSIEISGTGFVFRVREAGREWTIDPSPLLGKDCGQMCDDKYSQIIAWDAHYRRIYFAIGIGPSWERPWGIYNYGLTTHRFTRLADTDAAYFQFGAVSGSGRYLAYLKMHHQSAAGPCKSQTDVEIVDLWNRRVGAASSAFASSEGCVVISKLKWSSPTRLEYLGSTYRADGTAIPGGEVEGQVDVGKLSFH